MKIDLRYVQAPDELDPVPDGRYLVEIEDLTEETARTGKKYLRVHMRVGDGEHAGAYIFDDLYLTDKAKPRLLCLLKALNIASDGIVDISPELLTGKKCLIDVEIRGNERDGGGEWRRSVVTFGGYHPIGKAGRADSPRRRPDDPDDEFDVAYV